MKKHVLVLVIHIEINRTNHSSNFLDYKNSRLFYISVLYTYNNHITTILYSTIQPILNLWTSVSVSRDAGRMGDRCLFIFLYLWNSKISKSVHWDLTMMTALMAANSTKASSKNRKGIKRKTEKGATQLQQQKTEKRQTKK